MSHPIVHLARHPILRPIRMLLPNLIGMHRSQQRPARRHHPDFLCSAHTSKNLRDRIIHHFDYSRANGRAKTRHNNDYTDSLPRRSTRTRFTPPAYLPTAAISLQAPPKTAQSKKNQSTPPPAYLPHPRDRPSKTTPTSSSPTPP